MEETIDEIIKKTNSAAIRYMQANPQEWDIIRNMNDNDRFLFTRNKALKELMTKIDDCSGYIHSGASLAITMNYLKQEEPKYRTSL